MKDEKLFMMPCMTREEIETLLRALGCEVVRLVEGRDQFLTACNMEYLAECMYLYNKIKGIK